ncbi:YitT family protein [Brassicibacter mesophilus]|uniref:YitT family protein n=1 Tax=Brassicibacter mesophilus TaxID=745119 RepID=UPI003D1B638F
MKVKTQYSIQKERYSILQAAKRVMPRPIFVSEYIYKLAIIIMGNLLCAIAFNGFFIPNHLLSGGVGGISIMVYYLTDVSTGLVVFLINIPIFIIGAKIIDKKFTVYSFISMLSLSFLLGFTQDIGKYIELNDVLLGAVFGAVFNGLGMGILFRNRISQGGMDIIAAVLKKKFNINVGTGLMAVNTMIVALSSTLFGLKPAMYTFIAMYIGYQIVDKVQEGIDTKKNVIIISDNAEKLAEAIIKRLKRGVTFLQGEGGYSKCNKKVIYCIVTSTQIGKLKEILEELDPNAFMTINNIQEVKGTGFKNAGI